MSIQQLAVKSKQSRIKLDEAMCQLCTEIVVQDPSLGTSVPPDSEIQVVSVQKLIERKIISYSGGHDYKQF